MVSLEICVIATKRSGHHAFIEWIVAHRPGNYAYFNDVRPGRSVSEAVVFESNVEGLAADQVSLRGDLHTRIFSYENRLLDQILAPPFSDRAQTLGTSERRAAVLMVRDPINAFASVAKVVELFPESRPDHGAWFGSFVTAWKDHAKEFLGHTSKLRQIYAPADLLIVSFNEYIRSDTYASEIAQRLGMDGSARLEHLSNFATGGATFFADWNSYSPDVAVLESRWAQLASEDVFLHALRDPDFVALAEEFYVRIGLGETFLPILRRLRMRAK